ncbi:hypothetical protein [Burkholderia lata]|uniref:hypothetical protein n=1 Tax=Burkholderia lata (strain ATCC 17760 / DSM 23089 / LMG 22485 / NCIMB 9086 / R18194 / 383) TaxID=482957 RepID=UPI001583D92D|nr:hypothetical protein [Burkholderia lata]
MASEPAVIDDRVKIKLTIKITKDVQKSKENSMNFNVDDGLRELRRDGLADLAIFLMELAVTPVSWLRDCRRKARLSRDKSQGSDPSQHYLKPGNL